MKERVDAFDPKIAGKRAAEEFKADVLAKQARGEFGPNVHITFSEQPPQFLPPGERLN